ncbi:hypothetical protein SMKI_12G1680 [Saccharomyces mikatae IFO 1815]|uniref:F-box protein Hrt3/FBXO9 C-terminal domain-containing protein n=1 Tax=Saccharomyces mikatae IFO 1815 TaxID=226126 RepID=A0AA35IT91_SACMI|nr:uncharacterized protein SMKI_12G1680 [Saccharomyces mikatae IFO 1815]CAI4035030.1 hypothetical protein SMKI_12G1680 [Saccharomyces mikatae IFO 1815]
MTVDYEKDPRAKEAITIWERGVLKEKDGSMSDAINFYRSALKIHDNVELLYRRKLHDEWILHKKLSRLSVVPDNSKEQNETDEGDFHVEDDSELQPCWILEILPNDILLRIVERVVSISGEAWVNLSMSCSTFNKLCFHNSMPFKTFASYIYSKQTYDERAMDLNGITNISTFEKEMWQGDDSHMLRERPYIKFEGIYISVVNYVRYGSNAEGSLSLLNPVHMITYYRYLRFYENGQCLRLLTTEEPSVVVKHFGKENKPKHSHICYWSLGFDYDFGHLKVTRSDEKYTFIEELQIKNQGTRRYQRLKWLNSTVVDREGNASSCSLRNEKSFFFSRVKSFKGTG